MPMNGRMATAAAVLGAAIGLGAVARAEPLTIRVGWVVTPGHMAPLIEALGTRQPTVFKHLGQSYVLQPLRFNGTTPQIQAQATGDLEVASFSTSAFALAITNAHLDERLVADVVTDGHPGYFSENFVVLADGPIYKVEYRLPGIPRCGRVIRQAYHLWGIGDASILFSQRTGGGRAATPGTARERACVPAGSDDCEQARGDGA